jgi:hypothetical protein
VLDAELLFNLKNYREAATLLLDVVDKYPNSRTPTTTPSFSSVSVSFRTRT